MLARRASAPPRECLLPELLALGEIALVHGQPRDGKTWIVQELAVALVTGTSALHWDRFRPLRPARVMYITNEDGEGPTATRFQDLLDPRGLDVMPSELRLIVGRGCSFDDPVWQRKLIADIKAHAIDVVIADPLRSLSGAVDQGPRELQPLAAFLRRLVRETGCALLLVHHDVKPQAGTPDTRRRAQRSSGGGLFSIVDSPMHVERIDELRSVVTPDGFKHSADPAPFIVRREHGDGWTRIVGEPAAAGESTEIALQERIVEYLRMTPGASGSSVAAGVRTNKQLVYRTLEAMCTANTIDAVRERRGTRWFMKETV